MKLWATLLLVSTLLLLGGCSSEKKKTDNQTEPAKVQEEVKEAKAEKIVLHDVNGKEIVVTPIEKGFRFSGYEDKVVLVNFFATWCPPCKAEIPHLNNLQDKYKDRLVILSVLLEENKSQEELNSFIQYNAINYVIVNGIENFKFAQSVGGVKNIPLMFLYDKNGKYSTHYVGAIPEEMIEADIKKVL
ncbi:MULTISPECIES: TlpA disulfide reductase family protein [Sulfurospirillum]|jgi:thiol-disulfide isomerase/thioredoxin|uniref:TlpA family protein disulfide reductase n=1 Tax=Sulfurospirillum cavolei TaxID=366522 RepID=A0A2D3WH57_9BACT|nr:MULTISPECIES: TlpA disulfide reductase family protein [Sulfurospirillum]KHG33273.1 MAG: redoxin [Sulfurospirillum sp. MES]MCD8543792.1 TlpA family protein disulfide reductase [Sulfurospirillum cavolei]MCP3651534.1 TlpA family protein disulfide reductase [Sulfurospirillum sp. DNRA8]MCR1810381.1 TlpA family protein disulfide reductase [Sulfurospirillum sp. DNRA8]DAB36419.1 MAG TPA: TlpA family protein disulfide reductase [Sulfurospirillum cavolei]